MVYYHCDIPSCNKQMLKNDTSYIKSDVFFETKHLCEDCMDIIAEIIYGNLDLPKKKDD